MIVKGKKNDWQVVIGIEVHAQINTKTKLFSNSGTTSDAMPNTQTSFFDIASPGMLPVLNWNAVEKAVSTGLAINGNINQYSSFDRKHYFYPDLPQGYQITQLYNPIVQGGEIEITKEDGTTKKIRINRIHIEQDAGKLIHDMHPKDSCVDLNRAGIPLMEIVSEADMQSPYEACEYIRNLRAIVRAINTSDGDMDRGNFRCDINISVMPVGETKYGTRCEIKNVNSIKAIAKAIEFEVNRHVELIERGEKIVQQTRLFDAKTETTRKMRNKEDEDDYRYFPDPDLLPVVLTDEFITKIKNSMPELPRGKAQRYIKNYGLSTYDVGVIMLDDETETFFEAGVINAKDVKNFTNLLLSELFGRLKKIDGNLASCKISSENLAELSNLITNNTISGKIAKDVMDIMLETGGKPSEIVVEKGLTQVTDKGEIVGIIKKVLAENASQVLEYKQGKVKVLGFLVGVVMRDSKGKANPALANELLIEEINKID
jgi:aspartyl-tRNA(Asn)/glutamyl-tRNA(Gln) amidotransferase subunit B